jgi:hypothetical protein
MQLPFHKAERLNEENIFHLIHLYKNVFGKKVSLAYLKGKYDTSYLGKSYYGFIAFDVNNKPIGFHGCVLFRIKYKDITELGAQFGDGMTLKEYNGKGIFSLLGTMLENELKKDGVNFAYGLPNQNSEYTYINKLKWQHTERVIGFKIKTNALPIEFICRRLGLKGIYQRFVKNKSFGTRNIAQYFPHSLNNDEFATVLRDEQFYKYKSFAPNFIANINGINAWLKADEILQVGDIDTDDESKLHETIFELKKIARSWGLREIVLQYHPRSKQELILQKHFNTFSSWAIVYKAFNTKIPLEKLRFNYGDLDTF